MALYQFRLPDVGEGVAEAEITVWHVKAGDRVREDQSLVDVMTDKATVDMTSPVDGVVTAIHGEVGTMLPVGAVLVELEIEEAAAPDALVEVSPDPVEAPSPATPPVRPDFVPRDLSAPGTMPPAAPSTRRRARQAGIDLRDVPGSGPAGRITSHDLDAYVARGAAAPGSGEDRSAARNGVSETRIIGLRRKIAEKMQEAKRRIPHITYV
jgi:2-oxoisovalerate dehydrogenase E2 component (dihydrolipoyl transacylase)